MVHKRTRAAKAAAKLRDGWLYSIPRALWIFLLGVPFGTLVVLVAVMPTYFFGYQQDGASTDEGHTH